MHSTSVLLLFLVGFGVAQSYFSIVVSRSFLIRKLVLFFFLSSYWLFFGLWLLISRKVSSRFSVYTSNNECHIIYEIVVITGINYCKYVGILYEFRFILFFFCYQQYRYYIIIAIRQYSSHQERRMVPRHDKILKLIYIDKREAKVQKRKQCQ